MAVTLKSQRTQYTRNEDLKKDWILIDAEEQTLGRLAARIAHRLRGKHRPDYAPHQDNGDNVVVINAGKVKVSGRKLDQKIYYEHSGYTGGMKTATLRRKLNEDPTYALKTAVKRMLPPGPLGRRLLGNLRVFSGEEHGHAAQKPTRIDPAKL